MKAETIQRAEEGRAAKIDEIEVTSRLLNIVLDMPVDQQLALLDQLDSTGFQGARRQPRTLLKSPWFVMIEPGRKNARENYILDISRCGMYIETAGSFSIGEKIILTFKMPSNAKPFRIIGEIVRSRENGIGVKFKKLMSDNGR